MPLSFSALTLLGDRKGIHHVKHYASVIPAVSCFGDLWGTRQKMAN